MKHRRKVKGEQVITQEIAQQLKTKNINVIRGKLFYRQSKAQFLLETEIDSIDDEDKGQSVTDTGECQASMKKLQSSAISPISLHTVPQHGPKN